MRVIGARSRGVGDDTGSVQRRHIWRETAPGWWQLVIRRHSSRPPEFPLTKDIRTDTNYFAS